MIRKIIQSWLIHPLVRGVNIDSVEATLRHRYIIQEKSFLKNIYLAWYASILASLGEKRSGAILELGSGGGFFKEVFSGLITSEIFHIQFVDVVLDGLSLPFGKGALNGIVMVDVFHHLPDVRRFLGRAARCVKPGGMIVMIEPWVTPWSRMVYARLHHEPFDPGAGYWHFQDGGRMSGANSALPWIVFDRDRCGFEQEFPEWRIQDIVLHTPFAYLLSGGLSFRNVIPGALFGPIARIEDKIKPWMKYFAMFAKIVLVRNAV